jgi:hypothetical protein
LIRPALSGSPALAASLTALAGAAAGFELWRRGRD